MSGHLATLAAGSKSFSFAARFLPAERRADAALLYEFCRWVDDHADPERPRFHRLPVASDRQSVDPTRRRNFHHDAREPRFELLGAVLRNLFPALVAGALGVHRDLAVRSPGAGDLAHLLVALRQLAARSEPLEARQARLELGTRLLEVAGLELLHAFVEQGLSGCLVLG